MLSVEHSKRLFFPDCLSKSPKRTGKRRMEVAIPQLEQEGDSWKPVSWQPSDTKESMINNFGRIRYQVSRAIKSAQSMFSCLGNPMGDIVFLTENAREQGVAPTQQPRCKLAEC